MSGRIASRLRRCSHCPAKFRHQVARARVGQHPPHLLLQNSRVPEHSALGQVEQLAVRDAAPEEERQPRRQLQVVEAISLARLDAVRILLDAEEELGADQHGGQRHFHPRLEPVGGARRAVELERPLQIRVRDRPAVRPAHQVLQDPRRAGVVLVRSGRPADEHLLPARRPARPGRIVRTRDRHLVDGRLEARVAVVVEVRLVGLTRRLLEQRRELRERDPQRVPSGGHRHPDLQVRVHVVVGGLIDQRHVLAVRRPLHREQLHALAVEQQLHLMRIAQPFDVLVAVARQAHRHFVVAVDGERVLDEDAAARADRQTGDVLLLRQVRTKADRGPARRPAGAADRELGDLLCRRDVALEQRRRQIADRNVVEAEARRVARQQVGDVDLQRQQITDRVVVLGAVEAPEGIGAARVPTRRGQAVQCAIQGCERSLVGSLVGPPSARRWHLPRAQLAGDLLPRLPVVAERLPVDRLEREPGRSGPVVVARQTVAVDKGVVRRVGRHRRRGGLLRPDGSGEAPNAQQPHEHDDDADSPRIQHAFFSCAGIPQTNVPIIVF